MAPKAATNLAFRTTVARDSDGIVSDRRRIADWAMGMPHEDGARMSVAGCAALLLPSAAGGADAAAGEAVNALLIEARALSQSAQTSLLMDA